MSLKKDPKNRYFAVPSPWLKAPLFPPLPQNKPYEVAWGNYRWESGCSLSYDGYTGKKTPYNRGFDVRHFDIIAAIITEYRRNKDAVDKDGIIKLTYGKLLELTGKKNGTTQRQQVASLLDDLFNTIILFEDTTAKVGLYGRLVEKILFKDEENNIRYIRGLKLSTEFFRFISQLENALCFRADVKAKMSSLIAQSIYLYIPSRAYHRLESNPWTISLKELMKELRLPVEEKYKSKSLRRQLFTQHKPDRPSILEQLDGALLSNGSKMRVKLELNKDKTDYLFFAWVEAKEPGEHSGKLLQWWLEAGRDEKDYRALLKQRKSLSSEDVEKLEIARLDVPKSKIFFEMVKSLLPFETWMNILCDMKTKELEDGLDYPFGYFCTCVRNYLVQTDPVLDIRLLDEDI